MSDEEIIKVLGLLDESLSIFNRHEVGSLTAKQVSVKSMLTALRAQMMHKLRRVREAADSI